MNHKRQTSYYLRRRLITAVSSCILLFAAPSALPNEIHSLASMRLQAESFILDYPYQSPYPPRFRLGNLDSRLRLKACPEPIKITFARANQTYGNTAILLRCPLQPAWKIHLPVRIDLFDDVIVAAQPLLKGQKIDAADVKLQKQNIAALNNGYYAHSSELVALQTRRNLARGTVLTPANLGPRMMVRSGQKVTLVLNHNGLEIKSSGKALQSATLGQVIKVRNSQSQKIVEGVVSGVGQVRVSL